MMTKGFFSTRAVSCLLARLLDRPKVESQMLKAGLWPDN